MRFGESFIKSGPDHLGRFGRLKIMENEGRQFLKKQKLIQMIKCAERCFLWLLVEAYKIFNTFILVFAK